MPPGLIVVFLAIVIGLVIFINLRHLIRGQELLRQWAASNRYTLISSERRTLRTGPFFLTTAKGQIVYYVSLKDTAGVIKNAYVRVGGRYLGLWSDNVDIRWD